MIIQSTDDLRQFNVFIFKKFVTLEQNVRKRDTMVDAIFKKALREFHMEIIGYEAVSLVRVFASLLFELFLTFLVYFYNTYYVYHNTCKMKHLSKLRLNMVVPSSEARL